VFSQVTAYKKLIEIFGQRDWNDKRAQKEATSQLVGTVVTTSYNWQTYTIEEIDFTKSPKDSFTWNNPRTKESRTVTFQQYLKETQKITVREMDQPLFKTSGRARSAIYIVPEVCLLTDIDLDAKQDLPKICSAKPDDRVRRVENLLAKLLKEDKSAKLLTKMGIDIKKDAVVVKPTQLQSPQLAAPGMQPFRPNNKDWGNDLKKQLKWAPKSTTPLTVYAIYYTDGSDFAKEWTDAIRQKLTEHAAPFRFTNLEALPYRSNERPVDKLRAKIDSKGGPTGKEMVLCFLGEKKNKNTDNYNTLKQYCLATGIQTQCLDCDQRAMKKKTGKDGETIQHKLMMQIVNKMGELCWWGNIADNAPFFAKKTILIIGIDVYHSKKTLVDEKDQKVYRQRRSIGAFVAAIIFPNGEFKTSCWANSQKARDEIAGAFKQKRDAQTEQRETDTTGAEDRLEGQSDEVMSKQALQTFISQVVAEHKCNPDITIVYRDGVADSQLDAVKGREVTQVRSALRQTKIFYTVIQKRIHQRFYVQKGDKYFNPPPGTVINNELKMTKYESFFLIPTVCTLSTVRPVQYIVVHNDGIPIADAQQITFTCCHLYPNWSNSIKLPFTTQAAHKLAYLLGEIKMENPEIHQNLRRGYPYL